MGNTLAATHKIACGHTDHSNIRHSLLCDRLSKPTADMVESFLSLQGQSLRLQQFAERGPEERGASFTLGRPFLLIATGYCILFGYQESSESLPAERSIQSKGVLAAFEGVLQRPQDFLEDLLAFRAQVLPRDKMKQLLPLVQDLEVTPKVFVGPYSEVLKQLAVFLRAAVESAEIYSEIKESAASGQLDRHQAASLLDGVESDQKRMINAMGMGRHSDGTEEAEEHEVERDRINGY